MKRTAVALLVVSVLSSPFPAAAAGSGTQPSLTAKAVRVVTTARDTGQRMALDASLELGPAEQPPETDISLFVDPNRRFQTFLGIGGALTDASAEVFAQLSQAHQEELLRAYYDPVDGIGYTLARTTIHSCDFSSGSYTYVDEGDNDLATFSIDHDRAYRIPLIKRAIAAAGGALTMFASPWSPPAFMKSTGNMLRGGKLLPESYDAWARYFAKFIHAYEAEGIPIWGVTIQNEPMATQTWESCIFTAEEERDFLKNHLGPVLALEGLSDKKIIVWDHNRDLIVHRANTVLGDPEAARYVWGVGYHWYEPWAGGEALHGNLRIVHESFPDKPLLFTEGTPATFTPEGMTDWSNAERYGRDMIEDFNVGTVGWTDWNILLDERGGPNHVGNFCVAPVHADTRTGELVYTPSYFYLGHFSKFIRPGARRVSTSSSRSHLLATSFVNQDGAGVTVVMNPRDEVIRYRFFLGEREATTSIPARAIQTLLW